MSTMTDRPGYPYELVRPHDPGSPHAEPLGTSRPIPRTEEDSERIVSVTAGTGRTLTEHGPRIRPWRLGDDDEMTGAGSWPASVTPATRARSSTAAPAATPALETAPSSVTPAPAPERKRRGKGGARRPRKDPALDAELAGVVRPAPVPE